MSRSRPLGENKCCKRASAKLEKLVVPMTPVDRSESENSLSVKIDGPTRKHLLLE